MKRLFSITAFLLLSLWSAGQTCFHQDLSAQFNITVSTQKIREDSTVVNIVIRDKNHDVTKQSITFGSNYFHGTEFTDCKNVRSYPARINDTLEVVDNDYGDLIVADFNFDGLDDFAVLKDPGGNGGPVYHFYLQQKTGAFQIDRFLSREMEFFPDKIDPETKTLRTRVPAGVCWITETVYAYNPKTKGWFEKSHKTINICKGKK
jgi:hypothetical protein